MKIVAQPLHHGGQVVATGFVPFPPTPSDSGWQLWVEHRADGRLVLTRLRSLYGEGHTYTLEPGEFDALLDAVRPWPTERMRFSLCRRWWRGQLHYEPPLRTGASSVHRPAPAPSVARGEPLADRHGHPLGELVHLGRFDLFLSRPVAALLPAGKARAQELRCIAEQWSNDRFRKRVLRVLLIEPEEVGYLDEVGRWLRARTAGARSDAAGDPA
ncbi:MAG: hypothetical protein D6776_10510 [Planctomycetota bacterium]|nr:MAG: hypothetical protein D6776_10510 [Planctomycetota bacterium]